MIKFSIIISSAAVVLFSSWLSNPLKFSGVFKSTEIRYYVDTNILINNIQGMAHIFIGSGSNTFDFLKLKKSGDVYYNNQKLSFNNPARSYFDSIGYKNSGPVVWNLTNSDSLPSFTFTTSVGYPNIQNNLNLPNIISRSANLCINISNTSNYDKVEFFLTPNQISLFSPWNKSHGTASSINVNKSELCFLQNGLCRLNMIFTKYQDAVLNNKKFRFENRVSIIKIVNITN